MTILNFLLILEKRAFHFLHREVSSGKELKTTAEPAYSYNVYRKFLARLQLSSLCFYFLTFLSLL